MIQRIQTLFLFLVFLTGIAAFLFPVASFLLDKGYVYLWVTGVVEEFEYGLEYPDTLWLMIIMGSATMLAFVTIFLYKKRMLQVRLIRLDLLLNILYLALLFLYYVPEMEMATVSSADYLNAPGIYPPIISAVLLILANRFIIKDEKLIRSADRLR